MDAAIAKMGGSDGLNTSKAGTPEGKGKGANFCTVTFSRYLNDRCTWRLHVAVTFRRYRRR